MHQLEKKKIVDSIALEKLFSGNEKLTAQETAEGTGVILSAHEELKEIEGFDQKIFGPEFSIDHAIEKW